MRALTRLLLLGISLVLGWAVLPLSALADGPANTKMELLFPPGPAVGQELALAARVTDSEGTGVAGAQIAFTTKVSFLNTDDELELGRAVTDQQGIAHLTYVPRTEGETSLAAKFAGDARYRKSSASGKVLVKAGLPQHSEEVGLRVPGVGVWMLVAVLAGVWGTFLWALYLVRAIFNEGQKVASSEWGRRHV